MSGTRPGETGPDNASLSHPAAPANNDKAPQTAETSSSYFFTVGSMVHVDSRTWPGINKPGGVGRITKCHSDQNGMQNGGTPHFVDVQYIVVGGRERRVPIQYVHPAPELDKSVDHTKPDSFARASTGLRDRSMLLGRCKRCNSLRADCGSCDWMEQERLAKQQQQTMVTTTEPKLRSEARSKRRVRRKRVEESSSSSSSSSGDDLLLVELLEQSRRRQRRKKAMWDRFWKSSEEESSGSPSARDEPRKSKTSSLSSSSGEEESDLLLARLNLLGSTKRAFRERRTLSSRFISRKKDFLGSRNKSASREDDHVDDSPVNATDVAGSELNLSPLSGNRTVNDIGDPDFSPVRRTSDSLVVPPMLEETREMAYESGMYLEDFIQPEGNRAAERFPSDMVDRTKSLTFFDLPKFFDETVSFLENEAIPDAKLLLAEFQKKLRDEETARLDVSTAAAFRHESKKLYDGLVQRLIREGTDQCAAALRRIDNRREYRLHKSKLTREEKRQLRGFGRESRDIRLNDMSDAVDGIMRTARSILASLRDEPELSGDGLSSSDGSYGYVDSEDSIGGQAPEDDSAYPDELTTLPEFDPHGHALACKRARKRRRKGNKGRSSGSRAKRPIQWDSLSSGDADPGPARSSFSNASDHEVTNANARSNRIRRENASASVSAVPFGVTHTVGIPTGNRQPSARNDADVPMLEAILAPVENETAIPSSQSRRTERSIVSITDRMEAFLSANSSVFDGGGFVVDVADSREEIDRSRKTSSRLPRYSRLKDETSSRRQAEQWGTANNDSDSGRNDDSVELPIDEPELTAQAMYERLGQATTSSNAEPVAQLSSCALPELCNRLLSDYPRSPRTCQAVFIAILESWQTTSDVNTVLSTALTLLQIHGNFTLVEAMSSDLSLFQLHLRLLAFIVDLLSRGAHKWLVAEDGLVFTVFSESMVHFISSMTAQLVDAVYALALPVAWACEVRQKERILEYMAPLRDALGRIISLPEEVCRYIINDINCQQWWKSPSGDHAFVSSIDPSTHTKFIMTGNTATGPGQVSPVVKRHACFKEKLPRSEVDAIWLLLAYAAGSPQCRESKTSFRWRLILQLFYCTAGTLSKLSIVPSCDEERKCPPSSQHLHACEFELCRLDALLSRGSLDPLPDSDGVIMKLIQNAMLLQAAAYANSRAPMQVCQPTASKRDMSRLVNDVWAMTDIQRKTQKMASGVHGHQGVLSLYDAFKDLPFQSMGCPVVPFSGILRCCVRSLVAWSCRLPHKKARCSRFKAALQGLVDQLVTTENSVHGLSCQKQGSEQQFSEFSKAFPARSILCGDKVAKIFYTEAAILFMLVGELAVQSHGVESHIFGLSAEARAKIWQVSSDSQLAHRQRVSADLGNGADSSSLQKYEGSILALLASAKTIALAAFIDIGVQAGAAKFDFVPCSAVEDDALIFYVSCLLACLECAVDLLGRPELIRDSEVYFQTITCMCTWIAVIVCRATVALAEEGDRLKDSSLMLAERCLEMVDHPARHCVIALACFEMHTNSGTAAMRSVLALIRGAVVLTTMSTTVTHVCAGAGRPISTGSPNIENDDLFGSMDDSLFLDLKEDPLTAQSASRVIESNHEKSIASLSTLLIELLEVGKPSKRFAVLPAVEKGQRGVTSASISGRAQIVSSGGCVCECLAVLATLAGFEPLINRLDSFLRPASSLFSTHMLESNDLVYFKHIAQCFYSETCRLAEGHPKCNDLVVNKRNELSELLIEALLDSSTLERFPTVGLERLRQQGGKGVEAKEIARLSRANADAESRLDGHILVDAASVRRKGEEEGFPGPSYNSRHIWSFFQGLCSACSDTDLGGCTLFAPLDVDLQSFPDDKLLLVVCLESEALKRVRLLRSMLFNVKNDAPMFERVARIIVSTCAHNLLSISEGLRYHAGSRLHGQIVPDGQRSHRHSKLLELQRCYCELTAVMLSLILEYIGYHHTDAFVALLRFIRDNFLARVLQRNAFDVQGSLRVIISLCVSQCTGLTVSTPDQGAGTLQDELFRATIRRSAEFVRHIASDRLGNAYSFHHALYTACVQIHESNSDGDCLVETVASAYYLDLPKKVRREERDQLEESIDKYLGFVSDSHHQVSTDAMDSAKHFALDKFVILMLNRSTASMEQKSCALHFLCAILRMEIVSTEATEKPSSISRSLLCSACKAISSFLCALIETPCVDDDTAAMLLSCARLAVTVPWPDDSSISRRTSVLRWSQSVPSPDARYVANFVSFIKELATMVSGQTESQSARLSLLRVRVLDLVRFNKSNRINSIWEYLDESLPLAALWRQLNELEKVVFSTKENVPPVANVYATQPKKAKPTTTSSVQSQLWKPSPVVRRAAKEFLAEVIPVL